MKPVGMQLAWITVADIKKAIKFYTEVLGFELHEFNEEFGWAELSGKEGSRLGLAQECPEHGNKAGTNAVITVTVKDIAQAINELNDNKVKLVGEVMEIPGQVKLQTFTDQDGNAFQLCELLG